MGKKLNKKVKNFTEQDRILRERARPFVMESNETNVLEIDYILANYTRKINQNDDQLP